MSVFVVVSVWLFAVPVRVTHQVNLVTHHRQLASTLRRRMTKMKEAKTDGGAQ